MEFADVSGNVVLVKETPAAAVAKTIEATKLAPVEASSGMYDMAVTLPMGKACTDEEDTKITDIIAGVVAGAGYPDKANGFVFENGLPVDMSGFIPLPPKGEPVPYGDLFDGGGRHLGECDDMCSLLWHCAHPS